MRFGRWHRLEEAAAAAPDHPAVFQIKLAAGLVSYPTGKSAMILYGASPDPAGAVAGVARAHPGQDWMVRFSEDMSPREQADPDAIVAGLLVSFRRRFGSPPRIPGS